MNEPVVLNFNINQCLECPVCMDFLCAPVNQCSNGHSICGQCIATGSVKVCPICRIALTESFRNYSLEKILENITTTCRCPGCKEVVNVSKRAEHQKLCRFNPNIECTISDCYWNGPDLCSHLKSVHAIKEFEMNSKGTRGWNSKT